MSFIIQDITAGTYLKHTGAETFEHPYHDVNMPEDAEQFPNFDRACYAAFWYADMSRKWRVIDTVTGRAFIHESGGTFKLEREQDDEDDEAVPLTHRFRWKDRVGCVEAIAAELADNGSKYDLALRSVRLSAYAFNATRIPQKQKAQLKRDAIRRAKDIQHMRESADVGDVVRVPKMVESLLPGSSRRDGRKLVEAVIISKYSMGTAFRYTVKRLEDGGEQSGSGHMIKAIVQSGRQAKGG